jgi:YhcH/YjgK/YiaL family protein
MKNYGAILLLMCFPIYFSSCSNQKKSEDKNEIEKFLKIESEKSSEKIIIGDKSINTKELAWQISKNKERWEKALLFLKTTDLEKINIGRHELDGNKLFVLVDEYITREEKETQFEAHKKYADIQYLVFGQEKIGISNIKETVGLTSYDSQKDIKYLSSDQNNYHIATPERFYIFFPLDAHRPGVKVSDKIPVRTIVIKVLLE